MELQVGGVYKDSQERTIIITEKTIVEKLGKKSVTTFVGKALDGVINHYYETDGTHISNYKANIVKKVGGIGCIPS